MICRGSAASRGSAGTLPTAADTAPAPGALEPERATKSICAQEHNSIDCSSFDVRIVLDSLGGHWRCCTLATLTHDSRRYTGVGSPATTWLFPGLRPGRPLTAARLGERLRKLGIHAQPGRRAALVSLAAQLPAAVLADLLHLHPTTAVKWVRDTGGDWNRYAAQLDQTANHQP